MSALEKDPLGRLVFTAPDGQRTVGCTPIRAFPLSAPHEGISLVSPQGHELMWLADLNHLPETEQTLIQTALALREFAPTLERIVSVSTFSTPSCWRIQTDRGFTELELDNEESIRRLPHHSLLITDTQGRAFKVIDTQKLDRHSRHLLERFL